MRQRVKLAQALMHEPDLLVLDEPMNGLDPMGRQEIAQLLKQLAAHGTAILVSSHILAELESLCGNILMLNWGRILASGDTDEIRSDIKNWPEELLVRCDAPEALARCLFESGLLVGFDIDSNAGTLSFRIKQASVFYEQWTGLLQRSGVRVYEIRSLSRSLRQVYDKVTT
jgi:ABC-2 type transport system ATP-binding protein